MGVSVGDGGGGRGKNQNFDLNLVPFIDLLSVCITFLLATAVWTQIMSMQVDQAIQDPNTPPPPPPDKPPTPPLSVHIRADGVWAGRQANGQCLSATGATPAAATPAPAPAPGAEAPAEVHWGCNWPMIEGAYEWDKIKADLDLDWRKYDDVFINETGEPGSDGKRDGKETQVIIVTDDGVVYEHMIKALDITRELGYEKTLLGGGPPTSGEALPGAAPK